jgi:hypothetical protein
MSLKQLTLGAIFVSLATVTFFTLLFQMQNAYNVPFDADFNRTFSGFDRATRLVALTTESEEAISNPAISSTEEQERGSRGALSTMFLILTNLPGIYIDMMKAIAEYFNLSQTIVNLLMTALLILIVFSIIAIIKGVNQ